MERNDYKFAFTIGAMQEVCERCKDHDISNVYDLFAESDPVIRVDNMIWIICILNKWAIFVETDSFDGALTKNDLLKMDISDLNDMFDAAMSSMRKDQTPETEVEPTKKQEAASKSKS